MIKKSGLEAIRQAAIKALRAFGSNDKRDPLSGHSWGDVIFWLSRVREGMKCQPYCWAENDQEVRIAGEVCEVLKDLALAHGQCVDEPTHIGGEAGVRHPMLDSEWAAQLESLLGDGPWKSLIDKILAKCNLHFAAEIKGEPHEEAMCLANTALARWLHSKAGLAVMEAIGALGIEHCRAMAERMATRAVLTSDEWGELGEDMVDIELAVKLIGHRP